MRTVLLGANGKLGRMLRHYGDQASLDWMYQSRHAGCDLIWSGDFDDPAAHGLFQEGATLINMIGDTGRDADILHHTNVLFVKDLLSKAAQSGVAHVLLASSAAVYGSTSAGAMTEDAPLSAQNPYGTSKVAMELAVQAFSRQTPSVKITVMRIGNVAGADMLFDNARNHALRATTLQIDQFPDGNTPIRSYISPYDLFRCVQALETPTEEPLRVFNIGHMQPVALDDLAMAYKTHLFPNLKINHQPAPKTAIPRVTLSTTRLGQILDLGTSIDPADDLARSAKTYLTQVDTL